MNAADGIREWKKKRKNKAKSDSVMKSREELHQKLRKRILALPGVTERQNAGIHGDAFFVGRAMFMHIHGHGRCDIRLPRDAQKRILTEGRARPHRWAPKAGYVTFAVNDERDLEYATELIQISYDTFARKINRLTQGVLG